MRKLMGYELRKLFGRRLTQAALLAAVLFSALFTVSTYQNKYASYGGRQASGGEAVALDKEVKALTPASALLRCPPPGNSTDTGLPD